MRNGAALEAGNPFVGLRPFASDEAVLFFGRREQTVELLARLHGHRFIGVVGSSGCGKSSLIHAGLIPKLKAGMLVEDRDRWLVAAMKPGGRPRRNLLRALAALVPAAGGSLDEAALDEAVAGAGVSALIELLAPTLGEDASLLLLVDQFEEIFRFSQPGTGAGEREEAADFVSLMLALAEQRALQAYVVMTMRSDFLGDCDAFRGLPEALNRSQYLVPRLTRRQRREAIEGPVRLYRGEIAPRLVDRLLNEAGEESDQLPVLQHALMRLWEEARRKGDAALDLEHYDAIGTLREALSIHAEEALAEIAGPDRELAKAVFRALTFKDANNRRFRRPAALGRIAKETGATCGKIARVLEPFRARGRSFLMPPQGKNVDTVVDVSHESLIRQWRRLREWVDAEDEAAASYRRLADAARRYGEGKGGLLPNRDLELILEWQKDEAPTAAWAERYGGGFDQAMAFLEENKKEQHEEEARQRALKTARERERQILENQVRQARWVNVLIALILVLGGLLAVWSQWRQAQDLSNMRQLIETTLLEQLGDPRPGVALAALDHLVSEQLGDDEIVRRILQRGDMSELFELGPAELPGGRISPAVLAGAESVRPLFQDRIDDPELLAAVLWALDRFPTREPDLAAKTGALRNATLGPLRHRRPPPEPETDGSDWTEIPGGRFIMGSPEEEEDRYEDEGPAHTVTISGFWMLTHEVTNGEYRRLVPGHQADQPENLPAVNVSWYEAYTYCAWLGGSLPTEAEWEYAARAGTATRYWSGDTEEDLDRAGWYGGNSGRELHPVGRKDPNPWGLYDVHGNAWEWVADWFGPYSTPAQRDPAGPAGPEATSAFRVLRGGSASGEPWGLRSASRSRFVPVSRDPLVGFRCVRRPRRQP